MTKEQKDLSLSSKMQFNEKDSEFNCEKHGVQKVKIFSFSKNSWTQPYCPKCQAEEKEAEEKRQKFLQERKEEEMKQSRIRNALGRTMIPERFKNHSFETFIAETEEQKTKKQCCFEYANDFDKVNELGVSMIFCGTTGTGKTHLACSIASHVIKNKGKTAVFLSVIRAIRQVKETYTKGSEKTEQEAINWFLTPDLLILDEVGVQFGSEAERLILFEILNERYQNMKPTILISNLALSKLTDYVGERVIDRMKENGGKLLHFQWKSKRGA